MATQPKSRRQNPMLLVPQRRSDRLRLRQQRATSTYSPASQICPKLQSTNSEPHSRPFHLMRLPIEVRLMIYRYALVDIEDDLVPRNGCFRYRCNYKPHFWKSIRPTNHNDESWYSVCQFGYGSARIKNQNYGFGLFLTSRSIYKEAWPIFFEENHFVFEDRYNLLRFVEDFGEGAQHIQSLTMNLVKSSGWHHQDDRDKYSNWKLRYTDKYGPSLAESVRLLGDAFPRLQYLEVVPQPLDEIPFVDRNDMKKPFTQHKMVKALCKLNLRKIQFVKRSLENIPEHRKLQVKSMNKRSGEIEEHIRTRRNQQGLDLD